jgi:hypothetical protein
MLRYVRITAAVGFALLALALIGLWVRSYYQLDVVEVSLANNQRLTVMSSKGAVICDWAQLVNDSRRRLTICSMPATSKNSSPFWAHGVLGFDYEAWPHISLLTIPNWFLVLVSGAAATTFALKRRWQFSLRALLILTTLLAGSCWFVVYLLRPIS